MPYEWMFSRHQPHDSGSAEPGAHESSSDGAPRASKDKVRISHKIDGDVPLRILQASRSLRRNLPVSDSANLSRLEEDVTLCYARPSEGDLTACASALSALKINNLATSASVEFSFPNLPEIPDWYDSPYGNERPKQEPEGIDVPAFNTPQSDYHSLADYHPASICCQGAEGEPAGANFSPSVSGLSNSKQHAEPPAYMQAPSQPRPTPHRPRLYSFDLIDRRPEVAELPLTMPLPGLGYGLGSPFSPSTNISVAHANLEIYTQPTAFTENPNNQSPPGLRRYEALSVWRPQGPVATHLDAGGYWNDERSLEQPDDIRSLEQPFPSSASIWVLDPVPSSASPHSTSVEPPLHRMCAKELRFEEQLTLAVLKAMDSRDACHWMWQKGQGEEAAWKDLENGRRPPGKAYNNSGKKSEEKAGRAMGGGIGNREGKGGSPGTCWAGSKTGRLIRLLSLIYVFVHQEGQSEEQEGSRVVGTHVARECQVLVVNLPRPIRKPIVNRNRKKMAKMKLFKVRWRGLK
ncbi:hypothetical protein C8R43DRAFT_1110111 [Mycena crocata]|nr:hypothetical protein C8R43DRAFT_1110111 [Mycena crocata]